MRNNLKFIIYLDKHYDSFYELQFISNIGPIGNFSVKFSSLKTLFYNMEFKMSEKINFPYGYLFEEDEILFNDIGGIFYINYEPQNYLENLKKEIEEIFCLMEII